MPAYVAHTRFLNDYHSLGANERDRFLAARRQFTERLREWEAGGCLGVPRFPKSLGVKPMKGHSNIWELAWSGDGRCTWQYGTRQKSGHCHIIWRRIGDHRIYDDP